MSVHPIWHLMLWLGIILSAGVTWLLFCWLESVWLSIPLALFLALYIFAGLSILGNHLERSHEQRSFWRTLAERSRKRRIVGTPSGSERKGIVRYSKATSLPLDIVVSGSGVWMHSDPLLPKWLLYSLDRPVEGEEIVELLPGITLEVLSGTDGHL